MAGLGRKVFNAGEVLSAANVQGYLQDQVVQVYSGTAARSSALGTAVSEGMASYRTDDNVLEVYTTAGTVSAWSPVSMVQSPNAFINGAFDIWQRGTTFSNPANGAYTADRWYVVQDGTGATRTISQQTFTPGSAPVAGYEGRYFYRYNTSVAGSGQTYGSIAHRIEDVRTFAGQTVTISFWAKADTTRSMPIYLTQIFGTGGSSLVDTLMGTASLTTSWTRFSYTATLPSVTGKTIATNDSSLQLQFVLPINTTQTIDIWGVQLEAGSVATPFRRNAPSLQGELAACQRYYFLADGTTMYFLAQGQATSSTAAQVVCQFPVTMRTAPSFTAIGTLSTQFILINASGGSAGAPTSLTLGAAATNKARIDATIASGLSAGNATTLQNGNTGTGLSFSAEL